jgi:hypothetical protein
MRQCRADDLLFIHGSCRPALPLLPITQQARPHAAHRAMPPDRDRFHGPTNHILANRSRMVKIWEPFCSQALVDAGLDSRDDSNGGRDVTLQRRGFEP